MGKVKSFMDKLLSIAPGWFYGLLSAVSGVVFVFISFYQAPKEGIFENYISNLGVQSGFAGLCFNLGLIIAGLLAVPFFVYIGRALEREGLNVKWRNRTVIISIIASITLSVIGFLPAYNFTIGVVHATLAGVFFYCALAYCVLYSLLMWPDPRYSRIQSIIGFSVAGVFAIFLLTGWVILEWALFFAIAFYVSELAIYVLIKKI